ncbi:hypothetical protein AAMO2058_001593200 [Amorphochlora amoebiformis]
MATSAAAPRRPPPVRIGSPNKNVPSTSVYRLSRAGSRIDRSRGCSKSSISELSPTTSSPSWRRKSLPPGPMSPSVPRINRSQSHARLGTFSFRREKNGGDMGYSNIPDVLPVALDRAWEAKEELKSVASLVKEFMSAAEIFGKQMAKAANGFELRDSTTLSVNGQQVPTSLRNGYNQSRESIRRTATWLSGACVGIKKYHARFVNFRHEQSKEKRYVQSESQQVEKRLQKAEDNHALAKRNFEAACKDAEKLVKKRNRLKSESKESNGKGWRKLQSQVEKSIKKTQENANIYKQKLLELRGLQKEKHETTTKLSNILYGIEKKRITETKDMLSKLSRSLLAFFQTAAHEMTNLQDTLAQIDVNADAKALVDAQVSMRGSRDAGMSTLAQYFPYEGKMLVMEGFHGNYADLTHCTAPKKKDDLVTSMDVFTNASARFEFNRFLEKERSSENLLFWEAHRTYVDMCVEAISYSARHNRTKTTPDDLSKMRRTEQKLFSVYINTDAKQQVNISDSCRNRLLKRWEIVKSQGLTDPLLFSEAAVEIEGMLKRDTLRRFVRSALYQILASERSSITEISREILQPPPLGLHVQEKKHGYRMRDTFQGRKILEWVQGRFFGSLGGNERAIKVCMTLAKDGRIVPVCEKSKAAEWSEDGYYRVVKESISRGYKRVPFPSRVVDMSGAHFRNGREVKKFLWRLLMTPKLSSVDISGCTGFTETAFKALLQTLGHVPTLTTLKLNSTNCHPLLPAIADFIQTSKSIRNLELKSNKMGEGDYQSIDPLLNAFKIGSPKLESLDISNNPIPITQLQLFAQGLEDSKSRSLHRFIFTPPISKLSSELQEKISKIIERNNKVTSTPLRAPRRPSVTES